MCIRDRHLAEDVEKKLLKEVSRLSRQPFGSAEASVIRGYLDTCLEVPWNTTTKETLDIEKARKILDEDHYGLEKVKERIIEFLAVRKLAPNIRGTVLLSLIHISSCNPHCPVILYFSLRGCSARNQDGPLPRL